MAHSLVRRMSVGTALAAVLVFGVVIAQNAPASTRTAHASASGLSFELLTTHPYASQSGFTNGVYSCTTTFCPAGQDIVTLRFAADGTLIAGYGDWGGNSDSNGVAAGRVGVVPYNPQTNTWGVMTYAGSESLNRIREINGALYIPFTDPSIHGRGGYLTNVSGAWVRREVVPEAIHVFDIAQRVPGELWLFGSIADPNSSANLAAAWRSTDNGATWSINHTQPGFSYRWGVSLDGKILTQSDAYPWLDMQVFDGATWSDNSLPAGYGMCIGAYPSEIVELYQSKVACPSTSASDIRTFDTSSESRLFLSRPDLPIRGLYPATDGYLYILATEFSGSSKSRIYRTNDISAESFELIAADQPPARSITVKDDYIYLGGQNGKIYKSSTTISARTQAEPITNCFAFDSSRGAITAYYYKQDNDPNNPECPTDVEIPSSIDGVAVTKIDSWRSLGGHITSVHIPDSVTEISGPVFSDSRLASVTIPSSVTSISSDAFRNNPITSLTYNGVTYTSSSPEPTDERCFEFENGIITGYVGIDLGFTKDHGVACLAGVKIPAMINGEAVRGIGSDAFSDSSLVSVTIPSSVTSIGNNAFARAGLTSVTISDSVTSIGDNAFYLNTLSSVTIPASVNSIGESAFGYNPLTHVLVEGSIDTIGAYAFAGDTLESVTIRGSINTLYMSAFYNDHYPDRLHTVSIEGKVHTLYSDARLIGYVPTVRYDGIDYPNEQGLPGSCVAIDSSTGTVTGLHSQFEKLTEVGPCMKSGNLSIPSIIDGVTVTSIGPGAFAASSGLGSDTGGVLTSVSLPDSVTSIGEAAFVNNQLTSVTLGDAVTTIANEAFVGNRLTSITIPDSVTDIAPTAFYLQFAEEDPDNNDPLVAPFKNTQYVAVYTQNPSNLHNLKDGLMRYYFTEQGIDYDLNEDGDKEDALDYNYGGHLINPANVTVSHTSDKGVKLLPDYTSYGKRANGSYIPSLKIEDGPVLPPLITDEETGEPLPDSLQAQQEFLASSYYRVGSRANFTGQSIPGYTLESPVSPHSHTFTQPSSAVSFVYAVDKSGEGSKPPVAAVDFGKLTGSTLNPVAPKPGGSVHPFIASSVFAVDQTHSCNDIQSAATVAPEQLSLAPSNYVTLGGLSFALACSEIGGVAEIDWSLDRLYDDNELSRIRIIKKINNSETDITSQIKVTNKYLGGVKRTTLSYAIKDGQGLDDDSTPNGRIVDPIYVVVPASMSLAPDAPATGVAAASLVNPTNGAIAAGSLLITVATAWTIRRQMQSGKKRGM